MQDNEPRGTTRRHFLEALATGTAAIGMASVASPLTAGAKTISEKLTDPSDPEAMFKNIKGKHRVVFDATQPHDIYPFVWPRVFLLTNEKTGTPEKDNSVVVVLRHSAIGYAFEDRVWEKYQMGELFHAMDPVTNKASTRNPFWKPQQGAFKIPGIGPVSIGINELQQSGVMFMVCDAAMTVYSAVVADKMKMSPEDVKKEWVGALLPGIQPVPSGVWALGRAQEKGCGYIFAG